MRFFLLLAYAMLGYILTLQVIFMVAGMGWAMMAIVPGAFAWVMWSLWSWDKFWRAWDKRHG